MKLNKKYLGIMLMLTFSLVVNNGCERVLDVSPKGVLAEGSLESGSTVDKLVTAAYSGLAAHFFGNFEAFIGPTSNWIIDVKSDDCYKGGGGITDLVDVHQMETSTVTSTNAASFQKWRNIMFAIARCNFAIREINNLDDINYPKNSRIAEMRLLRGHFHFDLKRTYNLIPFLDENTDPTLASNTEFSSDELWDKIEADFLYAAENLPPTQTEVGRVNRYIAHAYLAKLNMERGRWAQALTHCDEVISSGRYDLLDEFEDLPTLAFESGEESVFTIQYSTANIFANHDWSNLLNSTRSVPIAEGGYASGDDFYHGSQNLVNAYRTDANGLPLFDTFNNTDVLNSNYTGNLDPRVDFTVGRIGIPWKGTALYTDGWVRSTDYYPGYSSKKNIVAPDEPEIHNSWPWAAAGLNFNLIRYAEVLLWKAEALVELNSDLATARDLVNEVRTRAQNSTPVQKLSGTGDAANYNIGLYPAAGWTQNYARDAVRFERRLELAMEGHRFYDLVRWGIAEQVIDQYYAEENDNVFYLDGADFTSGKDEYMPIPQGEIDLAPELYTQNPGY